MEKLQQWWRMNRLSLSFKNATIIVCFFNIAILIFLLFLSPSSSRKLAANHPNSDEVRIRYIKESEELRRAMEPVELIKRVKEIANEAYQEPEPGQQKDAKQTAAVDLISRLNNFRSNSDASSLKALEEWRKRKTEREKQRGVGKNVTVASNSNKQG
ncbi:hypothetical protein LguiB_025898 [Lonicera macranthoides]